MLTARMMTPIITKGTDLDNDRLKEYDNDSDNESYSAGNSSPDAKLTEETAILLEGILEEFDGVDSF